MTPSQIEALSFEIIDREAGANDFSPAQWEIVRRMIHTTADFEYMTSVRFHPRAVEAGLTAIEQGQPIFTDTNMAKVGMRQQALSRFGVRVFCLIADPVVAEAAAGQSTTRAQAAVDAALDRINGSIYVVGNAPTALMRLIEHVENGRALPALIVGLPVGFVNAAESKAALVNLDVPFISNVGRKGGSNLAAAVINALAIMAERQR